VVREKPEGGNLRLEVEEMENVERLKRSYYFRFQLSVFNFQLSTFNFLFLLKGSALSPQSARQ
jgi:CRISPR/Cas system-associated endoribonuclease Cas2